MNLISIIVPVYNVEKYFDECVKSILNQSYKNIEIILVNDGSTDNSGNLCDNYATIDPRIKVIHKENGGLSDARNFGMKNANGEYFSFIDSDDYIDKYFIENLYNALISQGDDCKISMCRFTRNINDFSNDKSIANKVDSNEVLKDILYQNDDSLYSVAACNKLYHKTVFNSIIFPKGFINEDMFVICEVLSETKSVSVIDYKGYYYRINQNSITQKKFSLKNMDIIKACDHIIDFIKKKDNFYYLEKAAINLKFRRCYQMLYKLWLSNAQYEEYEKTLYSFIKENKFFILKDKDSKKSSKMAAIMAMTGKISFKICTKIIYGLKEGK